MQRKKNHTSKEEELKKAARDLCKHHREWVEQVRANLDNTPDVSSEEEEAAAAPPPIFPLIIPHRCTWSKPPPPLPAWSCTPLSTSTKAPHHSPPVQNSHPKMPQTIPSYLFSHDRTTILLFVSPSTLYSMLSPALPHLPFQSPPSPPGSIPIPSTQVGPVTQPCPSAPSVALPAPPPRVTPILQHFQEKVIQSADIISTVEFNHTGELLATGDKGGRVVIFQREPESKNDPCNQGEYNVYSTFQSHEPEFDYLKSLEIEEKINKIKWLPKQNAAHSLLSTNDKTIKLWKISERDKRPEGYNLKDEEGKLKDLSTVTSLQVPVLKPMDLMVEVSPRRIFANGHTYHVNSISVNSDCETYMSADDLRINLWHLAITDRSFNIVDIKPANMEDLTEVITAAEFHPHHCNLFVYSSSKGSLRLCDMRASALCDKHCKLFEEPEDPSNRSFFSEIISSVSDIKFSHSGRYMLTRDYLTVKVWDLNMEAKPIETYQVHDYLRSKLCSLYENDCIFDKFECAWNGSDSVIMTGAYNNFFRMFDRNTKRDVTLEASRESSKPRAILKPRRVCIGGKRRKDDISVDSLDFTKKILHTAWHPNENIIAIAATNNLYIFQDKVNSEMH
uniref:Serine/threonine-protein phosphatase 2A 55 kDa regulatory subunit B n=1 Tax=Geotrypetes seraphini TaxID=260995 RepID=A0A6P8R728_GEOSA|nr:protein phosphatase 2, regulatory subunit B, gamma isoform X1 [Geotrypetes seraphini]XP_033805612.1 protein phosphatase 2, regulatory subunit B, gamma isoform X1 [Geotrypetes seraphini]